MTEIFSRSRAAHAVEWALLHDRVYSDAAAEFGLHPQTVRQKALELGVRRGRGRRSMPKSAEAIAYAKEHGTSWAEAARQVGVKRQAVSAAARARGDHGSPARPSRTECWWIAFRAVWTAIGCTYALQCVLRATKGSRDAGQLG